MTRKIEPFKLRNSIIAPHPSDQWGLDSRESNLFDSYAYEHAQVYGTVVDFYSLSQQKSVRDPLYDEAITRAFRGPYKLKVFVTYPDNSVSTSDRGATGDWSGTIWFPRVALEEQNAPIPAEGDVFQMWKLPYWADSGVLADDGMLNIPGRGFYFSISNVDEDGMIFDTSQFVGVSAEYRRRSEFTPERRITEP